MELVRLLDQPGREYTPFPFWFLNDTLTDAELCRQLEDFAAHGVYGVVLHPRIGLPPEMGYLSDSFFHAIETAVRAAERLGMRVILYDEGMYPSGSACGQVAAANPAYASRGIDLVQNPEPEDTVLARTPAGVLVSRFSRGTIRGIHFGEDDGEPNAPPSADLLNPDAMDLFVHLTHDAYYARLAPWFGRTIIGFFTDEPSVLGRNPRTPFAWTPGLEDEFTAAGGDLAELAALFSGEENASTRLYQKLILDKEGDVYYRRLSAWCAGHGVALVGHPHRSDDIEVERWFQIPGQDLALRWVAPEKQDAGIDAMMGHCSADAALLMGCRRNANECFGACNRDGNPWQLSGGDIKWYLDWLAVRGVNLFIPHAFYYSIEGPRKQERPPDVGPHSIWWGRYRLWSDYMRRLSALLTDAEVLVRVALPCRNRDLHPEIAAVLEQAQTSCCCLPESVWPDCYSKDGRLYCRGLVFDAVAGDERFFPELPHLGGAARLPLRPAPAQAAGAAFPPLRGGVLAPCQRRGSAHPGADRLPRGGAARRLRPVGGPGLPPVRRGHRRPRTAPAGQPAGVCLRRGRLGRTAPHAGRRAAAGGGLPSDGGRPRRRAEDLRGGLHCF